MAKASILIVEDDEAIWVAIREKLTLDGYSVEVATDGRAAQIFLGERQFDLVLLDLMLPKLDGISLLKWLRSYWPELPVLIMSAKGREEDKVQGLRAGADDYLAKPFGIKEMMARIEALLRRSRGPRKPVTFGGITVDLIQKKVFRHGAEVALSRKELELLQFFITHPGRTFSRAEILDAVWGYDAASTDRAVDYHVLHLRRKLEKDPAHPRHIITHHGLGYEFKNQ